MKHTDLFLNLFASARSLPSANGFYSVAKLKEAQKEINTFNNARFERALKFRIETFKKQEGRPFQEYELQDRVKISRIELVFYCERKENLY